MSDEVRPYSLPWFRVDTAMVDHPRVVDLCDVLGDPLAGWYIIRLWSWTMRYAPSGALSARGRRADGARTSTERRADGAEVSVERACEWRGTPGKLWEALVEVGWVEESPDGEWVVHDWEEHQGAAVAKARKDSDRKRERREQEAAARGRRGDGAETARAVLAPGARPARVQDSTGRDETKREKKGPPKKPAAARPSDELMADFQAVIGAAYHWHGAKDGVALAGLLKTNTLEEVRSRWRKGLAATGWASCRTVAQLASKWNDLAGAATPNTRSPVAAESVDWDNAQEGEIAL